ncbi:MAG: GxxExxY protein [Planctomycetes bacterium]|nr:GxxExxY protein [Planctomycetota bacterium]
MVEEELTQAVIGAMIEVHKHLGPGLLESAYHQCLCHELALRGLSFEREKPLPVSYKGTKLDCGYRIDLIVEGKLIVELKAIDALAPIHEAQLLTHMRLANVRVGLLVNFNVKVLKDGLMRRVL